ISGPSNESTKLYYQFASVVRTLRRDVDYEVDEEKRTAVPTEAGIAKVERQLGVANLYDSVAVNYVHQLEKALQAKELYHRDKDYLVADGEVKIVDEFTGRIMEGRRWSDGLHLGDDHAPELLPHVREALRHDRHRGDRGGRVRLDLPAARRPEPDAPADGPQRRGGAH